MFEVDVKNPDAVGGEEGGVLARGGDQLGFVRISANSKNVRENLQQIKKRPSKMTTNQNRTGGYPTEKLHLVTPATLSCKEDNCCHP